MKYNDNLHQLIRSLTKAEKRYFKLFTQEAEKGKDNNYIILFDALDRQETYNEAKLKRKLSKHNFGKCLAKTKYLLYRLILKALRQLNDARNPRALLSAYQENIKLLIEKGLYDQAVPQLHKAKPIAGALYQYHFMMQLCEWEFLLIRQRPGLQAKAVTNLEKERTRFAKLISIRTHFRKLLSRALALCELSEIRQAAGFAKLAESDALLDTAPLEDPLSGIYFHEVNAYCLAGQGYYDEACGQFAKANALWDQHPELKDIYPEEYQRLIISYVRTGVDGRNDSLDYASLLKDLCNTHDYQSETNALYANVLECMRHIALQNTEMAKMPVLQLCMDIEAVKTKLPTRWVAETYYFLAIHAFLTREYSEGLEWTRQAESIARKYYPQHNIRRFCKLLQLMARYELGEFDLLEKDIRNASRLLKNSKTRLTGIEELIIKSIDRLLAVTFSGTQTNHLLRQFCESLSVINKSQERLLTTITSKVFMTWAEKKLTCHSQVDHFLN